jgi:hypothetical protein
MPTKISNVMFEIEATKNIVLSPTSSSLENVATSSLNEKRRRIVQKKT